MAALRSSSKTKSSNAAVAAADEAVKRRQRKTTKNKLDLQTQPTIDEYATLLGADGHIISAHDAVEPPRVVFQLPPPTSPELPEPVQPAQPAFDPYEITAAELGPALAQADWESEI